jgi:hypothetical protein
LALSHINKNIKCFKRGIKKGHSYKLNQGFLIKEGKQKGINFNLRVTNYKFWDLRQNRDPTVGNCDIWSGTNYSVEYLLVYRYSDSTSSKNGE